MMVLNFVFLPRTTLMMQETKESLQYFVLLE